MTAIYVEQRDGIGDGGVGNNRDGRVECEGGVARLLHPRIRDRRGIHHTVVEQVTVEGQFPTANIAVVFTPTVHYLNLPIAVHRTANQVAERPVWMEDVAHVGGVGGYAKILLVGMIKIVGNSSASGVGGGVNMACTAVGVALVDGLRPTIIPTFAHRVALRVAKQRVGLMYVIKEWDAETISWLMTVVIAPAPFGWGNASRTRTVTSRRIFFQDGSALPVGTGDFDPKVSNPLMLNGELEVEDIFGGDDAGVAGKAGEMEGGNVGAAVAAVDTVGHEGGVGHTQGAWDGAEPDTASGRIAYADGVVQTRAHHGGIYRQDGVVGHFDQMQRRRGAAVVVREGHPIDTCGVHLDFGRGVASVPKIMCCGRIGIERIFRTNADGRCTDNLRSPHGDGHIYTVMPSRVPDSVQEDTGLRIVFPVEYKGGVAADESGDVEGGGWR